MWVKNDSVGHKSRKKIYDILKFKTSSKKTKAASGKTVFPLRHAPFEDSLIKQISLLSTEIPNIASLNR